MNRNMARARTARRRRFVVLGIAAVLLAAGCNDASGPAGPDPSPLPVPVDPRALATVPLPTGDHPPQRDRIDWSDDGTWLLYAAGPGSNIWRIAADGGGRPRPITRATTGDWLDASYAPCALAGGRVAFFHGWYHDDRRLHLLVSPVTGNDGEAVSVLHAFPSTIVGLAPEQVSSPQVLSLAANGRRAAGYWHEAYLLSWPEATSPDPPTVTLLEGPDPAGGLALARDGTRLAYVDTEGWLVTAPADDPAAARRVGRGSCPAWDGSGTRLAYLAPDGAVMVWDGDDTLVPYTPRLPGPVAALALSWDGRRIALLVWEDRVYGIHVGELANGPAAPGTTACP